MIIDKRLQIKSVIKQIKLLEGERVAILDADNSVRLYLLQPIKLVDGFRSAIRQDPNLLNGSDISKDGRFVAFSLEKGGAVVFDGIHKKLLHKFTRHEGSVESLQIDDKHTYLATGGQDGKTFVWNLETGRLVASLPHHADFVTAVAFSPNAQWIATGSFDRKILVTNISSLNQTIQLKGQSGAVNVLYFIKGHRLIVGDKNSELVVWDYFSGKVVKRLEKMRDEVQAICTTPDDRFLFVGDRSGSVALFDLNDYTLIAQRYLSYTKPVRKLAYVEGNNYLIVGLESGEVTFNAPLKEEKLILQAIEESDYTKAYKLVAENPLLRYGQAYQRLEKLWNEAYSEAIEMVAKGEQEAAKALLAPFGVDSEKRLMIQQIFKDYKEYDKFKNAVENKKYSLACSLVAQYPMLKQNPYYERMEKLWQSAFTQAKKLAMESRTEDQIKEILAPFRGIPSKNASIQTLLREKEIYRLFMRKIAQKDYKGAIGLSKRYPNIQELDEYKKLEQIALLLKHQAYKALEDGQYAQTVRLASQLEEFPHHQEEAERIQEQAGIFAKAMEHYANKNYAAVYKLLERYPYLEETQIVQKLEEMWQRMVRRAEVFAASGQITKIKEVLKSFLSMRPKWPKIVTLFKQAYLEQIDHMTKSGDPRRDQAIERYIALFGMDDELSSWLKISGQEERFAAVPAVDIKMIDPRQLPDHLLESS